MRSRVARVMVIFLTLLIGVALVRELFFFFKPSKEVGVFFVKPVGRMLQHKYKQLGHACGGSYYSYITGYEAPDGVRISLSLAPFQAPSEAKRELQKRLKDAISILERGAKYDDKERKVGERAVAFFKSKEEGKNVVLVLWTERKDMYEVQSYSLSHAVEFERTRQHYIAR